MYEFILRIFDYDTMEEFSSGDNIKTLNGFTDELIAATRRNVCLSEWFMLKHFTFEKVLERNRNFWNRAIVDAQGSDARRAELGEMFVATLGVKPRHDPRNPMEPPVLPEIHELMPSIAASLASNCSPWWVLDKSGEERYEVTMLVPFDLMDHEREDFESILYNMCRTPISVIDKSDLQMSEYISPFGYVAYSSDAIRRTKVEMDRGKHPLDQVRSLGYWNDSFVLDMLRRAELPTGESIFAPKDMNHAYGYISPCFVRDPYVAALRWKPWNEELEHAPSAENKVTPPRETQESFPDVFISYRRDTGLEKARTLQLALKARGYSVFFDFDSLQDGEFNEAIFKAIENCKVVVAFLSDGSLDRCSAEGDWVRMELEHAFKSGKKIIPVAESATYNHWIWPASLPKSLSKLRDIQLSEFHTGSRFEESVDKIVNARFGFKPRKP